MARVQAPDGDPAIHRLRSLPLHAVMTRSETAAWCGVGIHRVAQAALSGALRTVRLASMTTGRLHGPHRILVQWASDWLLGGCRVHALRDGSEGRDVTTIDPAIRALLSASDDDEFDDE